jgi:hypothetical protein
VGEAAVGVEVDGSVEVVVVNGEVAEVVGQRVVEEASVVEMAAVFDFGLGKAAVYAWIDSWRTGYLLHCSQSPLERAVSLVYSLGYSSEQGELMLALV